VIKIVKRWPNLFLVGAAKAGTTTLYNYLYNIPEIFVSRKKEPNYFCVNIIPDNYFVKPIRDKTVYFKLFEKATDEKFIAEGSVAYLSDPEAPKLIYEVSPNSKIIISLRDPVERVFSEYLMFVRLGHFKLSFHEQLQLELAHKVDKSRPNLGLFHGFYFEHVRRYLDTFGQDQVKIIIFEEFVKNIKNVLEDILKFLGISSSINNFKEKSYNPYSVTRGPIAKQILRSTTLSKIANKVMSTEEKSLLIEKFLTKKQPKPKITENDREILINYYRNDVSKLEKLLGRQMSWSNFHI